MKCCYSLGTVFLKKDNLTSSYSPVNSLYSSTVSLSNVNPLYVLLQLFKCLRIAIDANPLSPSA